MIGRRWRTTSLVTLKKVFDLKLLCEGPSVERDHDRVEKERRSIIAEKLFTLFLVMGDDRPREFLSKL